ncbi:SRPBCC domain-containing protein [Actinosynnema sp. NPDC047251]|uniref:Activator of Hsp90 ATPase homologue 1/2-like C-terminal domain-containing protein n=1 Tax=Saccharothrix espanaensis (strain ATCC 51144 / DSM 44229 / JCM 9112 / NBRC 15066 / NRRL 15764) TaxID=1179773 RepID=K0JY00_SACES|nr:SRPBCC domain-containing protein [Saccharothrix espanaensis]CCH31016.1 hypothetical protein BN6_37250 [Saccharothrix espanaensis DSM 44229]
MSESTTTLLGTASRARRAATVERVLPGSPEAAWAALTEPVLIASWFGPVLSGEPAPGGAYVLACLGDAGDSSTCRVREWREPGVLEVAWRYQDETADSVLRWELAAAEGGTRPRVRHSDLPAEVDPADYAAGRHMYTDWLDVLLAGGLPRRDSGRRRQQLRPHYAAAAE